MQALQLRHAQAQYREARAALRQGLADTEAALLRGVAHSTLALQPPMRAAPVMAPAVSNGQVPSEISKFRLLFVLYGHFWRGPSTSHRNTALGLVPNVKLSPCSSKTGVHVMTCEPSLAHPGMKAGRAMYCGLADQGLIMIDLRHVSKDDLWLMHQCICSEWGSFEACVL